MLGTSFGLIFAVGHQYQLTVSCIHLCNTTSAAVTVQLSAVGPSALAGQPNALLWNFSIPANDFIEFGEGIILLSGWSIWGLASGANSVNALVSGIEQ